jgi:hypothetical protein
MSAEEERSCSRRCPALAAPGEKTMDEAAPDEAAAARSPPSPVAAALRLVSCTLLRLLATVVAAA